MTSGMSSSQLNAVQITTTTITNLTSGPSRNAGATVTLAAFCAARAAARSIELADLWSDRIAADAAFAALACAGDSESDDCTGRRPASDGKVGRSRFSTNTELPQFVQNEREG